MDDVFRIEIVLVVGYRVVNGFDNVIVTMIEVLGFSKILRVIGYPCYYSDNFYYN